MELAAQLFSRRHAPSVFSCVRLSVCDLPVCTAAGRATAAVLAVV